MRKYHYLRVVLSLIVVLSMLVSLVPATVSAASVGTVPQKGTGTVADPYNIDEPLELVWMGENYNAIKNSCFIQTADINMSSVANFTPIGSGNDSTYGSEADNFTGVFDGLGFKITHLTINSNLVYVGLFQRLSGTIKNVNLVQASITSTCSGYEYPYTGGISALINGGAATKNCSVSGSISQSSTAFGGMTGGIAGENSGAVSDCFCSAAVTATNVNGQAGGIVGYTFGSASVSRCGFSGSVGGAVAIIGSIVGNYFQGTIANNVFLIGSAPLGCGGSAGSNTGCTPADISQIKLQKTYTDASWDFDSVWKMDPVTGYPTLVSTPGIPQNVAVESGNNQITVQWDAAEYASGYNVYYGTSAGIYGAPITSSGTSAVISGLTNMTQYYIAVKALHGLTTGSLSTEVTCIPHIIISDLTAAGSLSSVNISFTAPAGASLVELQQSKNNGLSYTTVAGVSLTSVSTGTTLTGLVNGIYMYRLRLIFTGVEVYSNIATASVGGNYLKYASASASSYDMGGDSVYVGCYYGVVDDAALKFDLSDGEGTVKSAYLNIRVNSDAAQSFGNAVFDLYGYKDDSWTSSLPAFPSVPSNSVLIQAGITGLTAGTYIHLPVTDFVKNQFEAGDKVISFYLAGHLTSLTTEDDVLIYSAASGENRPQLVIEFASNNANLSAIKVDGTNLPGFSAGTNSYSYTAPHDSDLTALQFTSTLEDSSATQGVWTYNSVNHTWSVTVTAQDTMIVKTYSVTVGAALQSSDASLTSISINGTPLAGFSSSNLGYTYIAAHDTVASDLFMSSIKKDHMAVPAGWLYDAVSKKWSNTVTAEDGMTKTYTVTINVLPDTDATLKSIKVGGTDITGFSPSVLVYTCSVVHGTVIAPSSFVSATNDINAIQGTWTYNSGTGKWSVLVTAEDGTTQKTYTVTIHELPSTDATLKSIKVNGTDISGFTPATLHYTVNVPHGTTVTSVNFVSAVNDHGAVQQNWSFDPFTGRWADRVTAEDGVTELVYFITINELPSTDAALKSIKINGTDISGFLPSKLDYVYSVAHGSNGSALSLASTVNDHMAQQGTWTYDAAVDKWSVTVTAEDNSTQKTYTVTMQQLPSTDASLNSIKINGTGINGFLPATFNYVVDVPHGSVITPESFVSTTSDDKANQEGWIYEMHTGEWIENVKAEDGVTRLAYAVTINVLPSTDATLKSIKVNGTAVGNFSPSTLDYTFDVVHGTVGSALGLVSVVNDHMANQGIWSYDAVNHKWSITVTAQDSITTLTYFVTINELPSADADLKSITVGGAAISEFQPSTLDYTVTVAHGTVITSASFVSTASDHMAQQGTWTYSAVTGKWSVLVTAEDGTTQKTYTVTINELPDTDAMLKSITIDGTEIAGFSPLVLDYTVNVVHGTIITAASFVSAASDVNALQGTWSYDAVTDKWSVLVTAEDGVTVLFYTVTINELPSTDATLTGIKIGGNDVSGFSSSTLDYTYDVVHGTDGATLSLVSSGNDHMAQQGTWTFDAASHTWNNTVTAEDGITRLTYTVTINELPDTDAALKSIAVNGTAVSSFLPSTMEYTVTVAHGTAITAASFASAVADDNAAQGTWTYSAATGKWSVLVTAENGTTQKTYTVTINELPDTNANLKSIKIDATVITGFSPLILDYTCSVAHGTAITAANIVSAVNDDNAVQGAWTYSAVTGKWSVLVTAEDGTTQKTYTITIHELPSTDASLKSIKIGGTDIAGFVPSTLDYAYTAVYGTDLAGLVFTSTCSDTNAAQSAWTYDSVNHKWSVTVTAQDTTVQKTYNVTVVEGAKPTDVLGDYRTNTLSYMSHVQDIGWQDAVSNGYFSGTTGQSKRLEAVKINLLGIAGGIEYCTHVQDIGWMDWSADGSMSGTTAQSKRLEAIKIRLTGEAANMYDIYYRVHVQDTGWMDWAKNGESAGTAACSYRMESIQIVMVLKGDPAPGPTEKAFYNGHTGTYNGQ